MDAGGSKHDRNKGARMFGELNPFERLRSRYEIRNGSRLAR